MKKIKYLKEKLFLSILFFIVVLLFYIFKIDCIYKTVLGIPCVCCGMTRAVFSAIRFDFISAFKFNPMFWSLPVIYLYFLLDGKLFKSKKLNIAVISFIILGLVANWVIKIL